jgi:hypothetical protein
VRRSRCLRIPKYLFLSIAEQGGNHRSLSRFQSSALDPLATVGVVPISDSELPQSAMSAGRSAGR